MTLAQLERLCLFRLGGITSLADAIPEEIRAAQASLESEPVLPWFLQSIESLSTVAEQTYVTLPTGFLREAGKVQLLQEDGSYVDLQKVDLGDLLGFGSRYNAITELDYPTFYSMDKSKLYLYPTPTAIETLRWVVYKADSVLQSTTDSNEWSTRASDLLLHKSCETLARLYLFNEALATQFRGELVGAYRAVISNSIDRELENMDLCFG